MLLIFLPSLSHGGDWWMLAAQRNSQGKRTGFTWADLRSLNVSDGKAGIWLNLVSMVPVISSGETGSPLTYTSMMTFVRFDCRKNTMRNEQLIYRDQGENLIYINQSVRQEWLAYVPNSPWELAYDFSCKGLYRDAWRHKGDIAPQKFSRENLLDDLTGVPPLIVR